MEQKKILWIIFSVFLLVVVVVGAGLIWFFPNANRPSNKNAAAKPGQNGKEALDPVEWVRKNQEYPGITPEADQGKDSGEDFIIVYGENDAAKSGEQPKPGTETGALPETLPVTPKPSTEVKPASAATKPAADTQKPAAVKPEPTAKPAPPKTVRVEEYWIQTGSYASKTRAEEVKFVLQEKGVVSKISSKLVDEKNYYRVRIGPYASKPEAEKFLEWIKAMQGFDGSYISLVYTTKEVR